MMLNLTRILSIWALLSLDVCMAQDSAPLQEGQILKAISVDSFEFHHRGAFIQHRAFKVLVKNVHPIKTFQIYHKLKNSDWTTFNSRDNYRDMKQKLIQKRGDLELWELSINLSRSIYEDYRHLGNEVSFQLITPKGHYDDNNNNSNYIFQVNEGVDFFQPELNVLVNRVEQDNHGLNIQIDLRNFNNPKKRVKVLYTEDNWKTSSYVIAQHQSIIMHMPYVFLNSPNKNNIERFSARINTHGLGENLKFAVEYDAGDDRHWDNYWNKDYVLDL